MLPDIVTLLTAAVALAAMFAVLRWRRRSHGAEMLHLATENVCPHLRPALDLLLSRGHTVARIGQKHPELPLEIHLRPAFDPKSLHDELGLAGPVFVSDRRVLYCKEDWCELHPASR